MRAFLLVLFLFVTTLYQVRGMDTERLDSLKFRLEMASHEADRVQAMIDISKEYGRHDLSMGLRYAEKSLETARASKNEALIADALMNMGFICFQFGLLELATQHYYEYIGLKRAENNQEGQIRGMINIAAIKLMMTDFEGTRDDLLDILKLIEALPASDETTKDSLPYHALPVIYNNLGVAWENMGDLQEAVDYYLRGISLARRMPGQEGSLGNLLNNLGKLYTDQQRYDEAIEALNEALALRTAEADRHGQASSYRNLARLHFDRQEYDAGLAYSYKGLNIAERSGHLQLLINFSGLLFDHFDRHNQADSALKYHKMLKEYSDRSKSDDVRQEITRMEVTAQYQERELLRRMEQRRRDQRYLFVSGLIILAAIILGLLYFLAQSRARRLRLANANMLLASEKSQLEREKLEQELEVRNKELTTNVMYQINKNELINEVIKKLLRFSHSLNASQKEHIHELVRDMKKAQDDRVWEEFEIRFHSVHNEFYEKLHQAAPDLSPSEKRLCSFLRLNMTTKEIASITGQYPKSIETARTRLRKKLNLTNSETSLTDFLAEL